MRWTKLNIVIVLAVAAWLPGCSESGSVTDPAQSATQAIGRAEMKLEASRAVGHAWVPTVQSLAAAKEAFSNADYASATAQAERAEALAEASLLQAESEKTAWRDRFPTLE
jgi:uncharacterized protein YceK